MEPSFIKANGLRFAYLEQGQGPLLLLLHGFPDTAYTWDAALPQFAAAGYRAVAPFMRGYHPTEVPSTEAYDPETLARDVLALIDAFHVEDAIIIGHDWGGAAAYSAAALAPERVRLLVALAIPHPAEFKPTLALAWKFRHFLALRRRSAPDRVRANDFAYVDKLWRRLSPKWKHIPVAETLQVKAAFGHPGVVEAACGYYRALRPPLPSSLRRPILVPTVALAGEHDAIAPRFYENARHLFKASYEVVQVPGGHFMHREHPTRVIPELMRVLDDRGRRTAPAVTPLR